MNWDTMNHFITVEGVCQIATLLIFCYFRTITIKVVLQIYPLSSAVEGISNMSLVV